MTLNQLEYFLAIAESGSILAASEQHYISRPAVSRAISCLETELGISLFQRQPHGVTLTPEGKRLLPSIKSTVRSIDAVRKEVDQIKQNKIRLGIAYGTSPVVDSCLHEFVNTHPELSLDIQYVIYPEISKALRSGKLDLCICAMTYTDSDIAQVPIAEDRIVWGVLSNSEIAHRGFITPEDLKQYPSLIPSGGEDLTEKYSSIIMEDDSGALTTTADSSRDIHSDDMLFLFSCVKHGKGILGIPELLSRSYSIDGITFVPEKWPGRYWKVCAQYIPERITHSASHLLNEVLIPLANVNKNQNREPTNL